MEATFGFLDLELFALDLMADDGDVTIDPVCRMRVNRQRAARRLRHDGADYWFCSFDCVALFAASPQAYASSGASSPK